MTIKNIFFALTFAFVCTMAAQAQQAPTTYTLKAFGPAGNTSAASASDARAAMSKIQTQRLTSSDEQTKEEALQQMIYLATHFKEDVNARRATMNLYEIYRLDRNEQFRIMALAGLHAIGSENIMRQLSQDVRLERSDKVRRLTNAALIDYFGGARG